MDVRYLIGEATEYDKKQLLEVKKPKSWCKSVSAFANTMGGSLIFGISDDGDIIGIDHPEKAAVLMTKIWFLLDLLMIKVI